MHLLKADLLHSSKCLGGLGIRDFNMVNSVLRQNNHGDSSIIRSFLCLLGQPINIWRKILFLILKVTLNLFVEEVSYATPTSLRIIFSRRWVMTILLISGVNFGLTMLVAH